MAGRRERRDFRGKGDPRLPVEPLRPAGGKSPADSSKEEKQKRIKELANELAQERDCDVLVFNYGFESGFELLRFLPFLKGRRNRRKNLVVFLTSEGGDADCAYRVGRFMQESYRTITVIVAGWCKSAGTLVCIAADDLVVCDAGELGPLDIQIAKVDEVGERSSGLAAEAAFAKLQKESSKLLMRYLDSIKNETPGRISFKTAADIASHMVTGLMAPIFSKIDPMNIGEDYRANLISEEYAVRLNLRPQNLKEGDNTGLRMLSSGYPSHRFVIDRKEASRLFHRVTPATGTIAKLVGALGIDIIFPKNAARSEEPHLEFINDEASPAADAATESRPSSGDGAQPKPSLKRSPPRKLRGGLSAGSSQKALGHKGTNGARPNGRGRVNSP